MTRRLALTDYSRMMSSGEFSEKNHVPYRSIDLDQLGSISPLKPVTKDHEEDKVDSNNSRTNEDSFIAPKKVQGKTILWRKSSVQGFEPAKKPKETKL